MHGVRLPRPSRPHHLGLGRLRALERPERAPHRGPRARVLRDRLRRLQPVPLRQPGPAIGRTLDLCRETEPSGDRANGPACDDALATGTVAFDDPRSPFDGTHRDTYLRDTTLANAGGPRLWWTDPYGDNAPPQPFPGAICQLVATVDTPTRASVQQQVFGRNRTHDAPGVHAPN